MLKQQNKIEINDEKSFDFDKFSNDELQEKSFQENKKKENNSQEVDDNNFSQSSSFMELVL